MFVRIPFEHSAPIEIADELDHLVARTNAPGEMRWIGNAEKHGSDLRTGEVAVVECISDRLQSASLRRYVDGQAVMLTELFGETSAIARLPRILAVRLDSIENRDSPDESAARIARDAATSGRREMKFANQILRSLMRGH